MRPDLSALSWRKSSHSGKENAECVELALTRDFVGIRDSKHPDGTALILPHEAVAAFLSGIRVGAFDHPRHQLDR